MLRKKKYVEMKRPKNKRQNLTMQHEEIDQKILAKEEKLK